MRNALRDCLTGGFRLMRGQDLLDQMALVDVAFVSEAEGM